MKGSLNGIRAILFDAGGTLIDLDSSRICDLISTELGIEPLPDRFPRAQCLAGFRIGQLIASGAKSTEKLFKEYYTTLLTEIGAPQEKLAAGLERILELSKSEMLWRKTADSTASILAELKERGLRLGVVSNSDGRIESVFKQLGLADYFDLIIDSFVVGVEKPDPGIFRLAVERASVAPQEAAYVGDLYSVDVIGARRANLIPVLYDPFGLNQSADCLRISAMSDLIGLIEEGKS